MDQIAISQSHDFLAIDSKAITVNILGNRNVAQNESEFASRKQLFVPVSIGLSNSGVLLPLRVIADSRS
jgi:hypothetical protein